jgi:exonuclease SbcD
MRMAIAQMHLKPGRRNVLLSHQFVTGAERSDSEENVGGLDNVDASVFEGFDYVALGHIHKPQNVAKDSAGVARVRYSGTPLKYSLSEANHRKSLTVIELGVKTEMGFANIDVREIPLTPMHDVREIRGTFAELVSPDFQRRQLADGFKLDDYVYVKLTDENDVPDAALKLRGIYPNLMMLDYDNERTRNQKITVGEGKVEQKTPMELFSEFFTDMTKREMNEEECEFVRDMIDGIWEAK